MKNLLLALALFLTPAPAHAHSYNIFFDETAERSFRTADWSGTYGPTRRDFSALIGDCADHEDCTYNLWQEGLFPHETTHPQAGFHGDIFTSERDGILKYIPSNQFWQTGNNSDSIETRFGYY